jgi:hypothetical protein
MSSRLPLLAPLLLLTAVVVLAPVPGRSEPLTLTSVTVELPESDNMFTGPGSEALNNNCLACHSAGMVLNQPALPKATWQAVVAKMIHIYKAPVAENEVGPIVDYLAGLKPAN